MLDERQGASGRDATSPARDPLPPGAHGSLDARRSALHALEAGPHALRTLLRVIEADPELADEAAELLTRIGDRAAIDRLTELVAVAAHPAGRRAAARALVALDRRRDPDRGPDVLSAYKAEDGTWRALL